MLLHFSNNALLCIQIVITHNEQVYCIASLLIMSLNSPKNSLYRDRLNYLLFELVETLLLITAEIPVLKYGDFTMMSSGQAPACRCFFQSMNAHHYLRE